jgi:hypothetical protein
LGANKQVEDDGNQTGDSNADIERIGAPENQTEI